jgi:starch synthase (maltosyl-transferring)
LNRQQPANHPGVPLIYNLFPRCYKSMDDWQAAIPHVASMGFNWIFVNPFHATGFSGSLYAIKNYYQINALFLKPGQDTSDWRPLKKFIASCKDSSIDLMMDLVINHTAFDSFLVKTNPAWYKHDEMGRLVNPHAIDPADADKVTVWGDLAEIDNHNSKEKKALWDYWDKLIKHFQEMGIQGFRCDAAYQVPADLWKHLISSAKKRYTRTMFLAETLGCTLEQISELKGTGFDYLFNSSKYWDFDKPWCLEQHEENKKIAPSISFPESHDTPRLAQEAPGTIEAQKMRYSFAAVFSAGLLMPMGFEFGAKNRIDVVKGAPKDVEQPQWDISPWIAEVNKFKLAIPVLREEGTWQPLTGFDKDFIFLEKRSDRNDGSIVVCINKKTDAETDVPAEDIPKEILQHKKMVRLIVDPFRETPIPHRIALKPADILVFLR